LDESRLSPAQSRQTLLPLKNFRRIATRYDKLGADFFAFIQLASGISCDQLRLHSDIISLPATGSIGFDITRFHADGRTPGDFGGPIQDFSSLDEAVNWSERCLVEDYWLPIDFVGRRPCQWTEKVLPDPCPGTCPTLCTQSRTCPTRLG
jgi:hypothetical protein